MGGQQIAGAADSLTAYITKFRNRLSPGNRRHLETMLMLARSFLRSLQPRSEDKNQSARVPPKPASENHTGHILSLNDFLFRAGVDNVNLMRLQRYVRESKVRP